MKSFTENMIELGNKMHERIGFGIDDIIIIGICIVIVSLIIAGPFMNQIPWPELLSRGTLIASVVLSVMTIWLRRLKKG